MGYRKTLASIAGFCGAARLAELLPHSARVVMCHGVVNEPIVDPLVQANQIDFELFRRNIEYLAKRGHFLAPDEFYEKFQSKAFDKRDILLTFDDGYVNNAEVAAPYLIEKQIPFMIFVSPGLVDANERIPSYYAFTAATCEKLDALRIPSMSAAFPLRNPKERRFVAFKLLEFIRSLNEYDLAKLVMDLKNAIPDDEAAKNEIRYASEKLMTWAQIEALSKSGFVTIGAHGYGHAILHDGQHEGEVARQLRLSRDKIIEHCGKCDYFAYANGSAKYVSHFAREKAKELYKAAFAVKKTQLHKNEKVEMISRISMINEFYAMKFAFSALSLL